MLPVISRSSPAKEDRKFKKGYKAHISLHEHLENTELGGNPEDIECHAVLRRTQKDALLPAETGGLTVSVRDAILSIRISDDGGHKRYAVYGLSIDDYGTHLLTYSGGTERKTYADTLESHPISLLFFLYAGKYCPPDVEEWLKESFLASDVKEQFENSTYDGKVVEFKKPGEARIENLEEMIRMEIGGAKVDEGAGSFDPEVDASRRSVGGEEEPTIYRFHKESTPAEIIKLAEESLANANDDSSSGDGSTSTDEARAKKNE